jgi:hypothetical protein
MPLRTKRVLSEVPHSKVRVPPKSDPDRLVRAGAVIFGLGLLAILAAVLPLFFGVHNLPTALNVAAGLLAPLGLGIALWALVRQARQSRQARQVSR